MQIVYTLYYCSLHRLTMQHYIQFAFLLMLATAHLTSAAVSTVSINMYTPFTSDIKTVKYAIGQVSASPTDISCSQAVSTVNLVHALI